MAAANNTQSSSSPAVPNTADSARRRSSAGLFSQLSGYKRDPQNAAYQARRQSIEDMNPKSGVFATAFNKYVYLDRLIDLLV